MRRRSAQVCLVLGFILSFIRHVSTLSITVTDTECVYEHVLNKEDTITGNFVVTDHELFWNFDHPGIDFTVTCPDGSIVRARKGTSGDKFVFKAPRSGMYQFCFHNPTSTPEVVSFYIHIGHIPNEHDLAKDGQFGLQKQKEHLDPIYVRIAELREALETVTAEQRYLKALESRHRSTNESTSKRVVFYTASEYLLLAGASALQVMYIRRLFGKTAAYGRV